MLCVDDHQCEIGNVQCRQRLAHEIEITWRVHDVELLIHPRGMQERCLSRDLSLPFAHVVIGDGRALRDTSHPVNPAAARQQRLTQDRFSGRRMPDNGKVADIRGRMACHELNDEPESARVQASRTKEKSAGGDVAEVVRPASFTG